MKKFLIILLVSISALAAYAQNIALSVTTKSPAVLYKNISEVVNQLPPNAAQAKIMLAMGFASVGAPAFEGVNPESNIALAFFDDKTALLALNASDQSLIYQMIAGNENVTLKRIDGWLIAQTKEFGEIQENKAKLAIELAKKSQAQDILVSVNSDVVANLIEGDEFADIKDMLKNEIDKAQFSLSLNSNELKSSFDFSVIKAGLYSKIFGSMLKAKNIPEAKFISSDNFMTGETSIIASQETIDFSIELLKKYLKLDSEQLEAFKDVLVPNTGTNAYSISPAKDTVLIYKTPISAEQFLLQQEASYNIAFSYFANLLKNILPQDAFENAENSLTAKNKEIVEIDSVEVIVCELAETQYALASVNGYLIQASSKNSDTLAEMIIKAIGDVKSDKPVQNAIPSSIDCDGILTVNMAKFTGIDSNIDAFTKEIFSNFAPLIFKVYVNDSGISLTNSIPTSNIVELIVKAFELQMKQAQ